MAGGKKDKKAAKKARKAQKKARKAEKKAAKRAAQDAARAAKAAGKGGAESAAPQRATRKGAASAGSAAGRRAGSAKRARAKPGGGSGAPRALTDRRKPESLRLRSAGPSLTVNDLQRSLVFYRDVLGFTVKDRWEENGELRGVELLAGSVSFWLGQDDWKKGRDRVKGLGFRIYCGTTQDVDAIAERVRAAGVVLLEEPKDQPWGGRDFAVVDPDGFTISIASGL